MTIEQVIPQEERNRLKVEFWTDCRLNLGYDKWLTERGVRVLEGKAWEMGHSAGYSEVYDYLCDLVDFVREIIKETK